MWHSCCPKHRTVSNFMLFNCAYPEVVTLHAAALTGGNRITWLYEAHCPRAKMANCFTGSWVLSWAISVVGPSWDSGLLEYDAVYIVYVYIHFAKSCCLQCQGTSLFFDYPEEVDSKLFRNVRDCTPLNTVPRPRRLKRTWTPLCYPLIKVLKTSKQNFKILRGMTIGTLWRHWNEAEPRAVTKDVN